MNKKAFTLIELLAVIIILGILATLIVPKILLMLDNAEKNTNMISAEGLVKSAQYKATNASMMGINQPIIIDYTNKNNIDYIDYSGEKPTSGQVKITKDGRVAIAVKIGDSCYKKGLNTTEIIETAYIFEDCQIKENIAIIEQQDETKISTGDVVQIGDTEQFYVVSSNATETILFAKHNLLVGAIYSLSGTKDSDISESTEGYGLQNPTAKGYVPSAESRIGTVAFSEDVYWGEFIGGNYIFKEKYGEMHIETNLYDEDFISPTGSNYSIAYYVKNYVEKLKQIGAPTSTHGRLLTWQEFHELYEQKKYDVYTGTSYWLGSGEATGLVFHISSTSITIGVTGCSDDSVRGVRPIIIVPTSSL